MNRKHKLLLKKSDHETKYVSFPLSCGYFGEAGTPQLFYGTKRNKSDRKRNRIDRWR